MRSNLMCLDVICLNGGVYRERNVRVHNLKASETPSTRL